MYCIPFLRLNNFEKKDSKILNGQTETAKSEDKQDQCIEHWSLLKEKNIVPWNIPVYFKRKGFNSFIIQRLMHNIVLHLYLGIASIYKTPVEVWCVLYDYPI